MPKASKKFFYLETNPMPISGLARYKKCRYSPYTKFIGYIG